MCAVVVRVVPPVGGESHACLLRMCSLVHVLFQLVSLVVLSVGLVSVWHRLALASTAYFAVCCVRLVLIVGCVMRLRVRLSLAVGCVMRLGSPLCGVRARPLGVLQWAEW